MPVSLGLTVNGPSAVAVDGNGRLYVIDHGNIWLVAP